MLSGVTLVTATLAFNFMEPRGDDLGSGVLLRDRQQAGVEEADLEEDEERQSAVDPVGERVEHRGREVETERQLDERLHGDRLTVFLADPLVPVALDVIFRRARKLALFVEERLEHGARVVDGEPDADRHQKWHVLHAREPVGVNLPLTHHVEIAEREGGGEEERYVDEDHLVPSHVVANHHRREHQDGEYAHENVVEVRRQMEEGFGLHAERQIPFQNARQEFPAGLDRALCPASLLRLELLHFDRHFGRRDQPGHEDELPPAQLRAIAQIEIFRERIVLPAAGVLDCDAAPNAGSAVEIEEASAAMATAVLENEMTVEQNRLDLREQRVILVDVSPARLHHADFRIAEVRNQPREKTGGRDKNGFEDADEFAARHLQAGLERARLVVRAIVAGEVFDVDALCAESPHRAFSDPACFADGIVEDLNFDQLT